jgi:hypothetical protein
MIGLVSPVFEILVETLAFDTSKVFYGGNFSVISVKLGRVIDFKNCFLFEGKFLRR